MTSHVYCMSQLIVNTCVFSADMKVLWFIISIIIIITIIIFITYSLNTKYLPVLTFTLYFLFTLQTTNTIEFLLNCLDEFNTNLLNQKSHDLAKTGQPSTRTEQFGQKWPELVQHLAVRVVDNRVLSSTSYHAQIPVTISYWRPLLMFDA